MGDPVDFMYQHHARQLAQGGAPNPGGGLSTYYGMTVGDESGRQRMVPSVWYNQILPPNAAFARAQAAGLWRYPGSFSPTRTLYNYMNDPAQHPRMEAEAADYLSRAPFAPGPE